MRKHSQKIIDSDGIRTRILQALVLLNEPGFVEAARGAGARTLELNLERSAGSAMFHETRLGMAGVLVPRWVESVLNGSKG